MSEKVPLLLLVNTKTNEVICAGANKEFVDVLCSFLTMPLGTIARLVQEKSLRGPVQVGCLDSLFQSVTRNERYLWSDTCKKMLLRPRNSSEHHCRSLQELNIDDTDPTSCFVCPDFHDCGMNMLSTFTDQRCQCGKIMDHSVLFKSKEAYQGFLYGGITFIISDQLQIYANSIYEDLKSLETFLESFVERFLGTSLQLITVNVDKIQVIDLLKCLLLSKTCLTDFFYTHTSLPAISTFSLPQIEHTSTFQMKVKIVLLKSIRKILYAEGEKDFVDFLWSFLTLPLGGVVRMLRGDSSMGSVDVLYRYINTLDENKYFLSRKEKCKLVDPEVAPLFQSSICKKMLPISEQASPYYYCDPGTENISDLQFHLIEDHEDRDDDDNKNYQQMKLVDPKSPSAGILKIHPNFPATIVTDDLFLAPTSRVPDHSMLDRLNIPLNDVIVKEVTIGIREGLGILKASLTSNLALTNGLSHLIADIFEENGC
ncbi:hypothetical protein VNO80_07223 [Phaseolus coccineus]|uniref:DUF674 family protein n=1 Tax=Phaseolus coccineus TaxID=3886 RepID=A0AAN9RPJ4_PHACN